VFPRGIFAREFLIGASSVLLTAAAMTGIDQAAYGQEPGQQEMEPIDGLASEVVEQDTSDTLDEIIVYGDQSLSALRHAVYRAEENFFNVFNSLNDDDEFDVHCFYETPSFTHIRRHVCRANFVIDATSAEAANIRTQGPRWNPPPAEWAIESKKKRLGEMLQALAFEHPELLRALNEYTEARQNLDAETDQR